MRLPKRAAAAVLGLLVVAGAGTSQGATTSRAFQVGADTYMAFTVSQADGPPVKFYLSKTAQPRPLVLYIQGSGCTPAFIDMGGGNMGSTVFSLTTTAHRGQYAVMIVDKPFAPPRFGDGTATHCPAAFNEFFSADAWVRQIRTAYAEARKAPWVDTRRALVIGISEGATVAASLASKERSLTDVALVGATGPTQLFDFMAKAYAEPGDDAARLAQIQAVEQQLSAIRKDPDNGAAFAWGHSYKRWSSFLKISSIDALQHSAARIYLASGMADRSVPVQSTEVLYDTLLIEGRDITFRRIPGAGHGLIPDDGDFNASMPALEGEFARMLSWFDKGHAEH